MTYAKHLWLLGLFLLAGCDPASPWIANGYSEPVSVATVQPDKDMSAYFIALKPNQCIEGWGIQPPAYTKITVARGNEVTNTYTQPDISKASSGSHPNGGVFVVSPSGLSFKDHFECVKPEPTFINKKDCPGGWPCSTGAQ